MNCACFSELKGYGNTIKKHFPANRRKMDQKKVEMESMIDLLAPKNETNRKQFVKEIATKYMQKYPRSAIKIVSKINPK